MVEIKELIAQILEMKKSLTQQIEAQSCLEKIRYNILNLDLGDHYIVVNHSDLNDNSQQKFELETMRRH